MTEKYIQPSASAPAEKALPRFDVKLIKEHRHAGKDLEAGETIKVTARQRTWLAEQKIIAAEAK